MCGPNSSLATLVIVNVGSFGSDEAAYGNIHGRSCHEDLNDNSISHVKRDVEVHV